MRWLLLLLGCWWLTACQPQQPMPMQSAPTALTIEVAPTSGVGVDLPIRLYVAPDWNGRVTLTLQTSYAVHVQTVSIQQGLGTLLLTKPWNEQRGDVSIVARVDQLHASATTTLQPSAVVEPIRPLVGARSIIANGATWSMVVVIPHDQFGNPIADASLVNITAQRPNQQRTRLTAKTAHLLAWQRLYSQTVAGKTLISAQSQGRFGPQAELLEVAGWPVQLSVQLAQPLPRLSADGYTFIPIQTNLIQDAFGNVVPDGTSVVFEVDDGLGQKRSINSVTIRGIAETQILSPNQATRFTIQARIFRITSAPLVLDIPPDGATDFLVQAVVATDVISVTVGPIVGSLQQYVPDGTMALLQVNGPIRLEQTTDVVAGYLQTTIRRSLLPSGRYLLTCWVGDRQSNQVFIIP
ncbi:hypothetical protein [Herpetosiphon geysericola]|uniref:Uncharacterized protein n=1 Tax=Herpetosiphon geysericola TaxID=70996 RepID=A0A0P6XXA8_9CHLR|nr:hypothetical protein [Herpetosiphon geysericola]KPL80494.1 hypothetical protein SE18_23835 [Herpetosiphon geysericola]